MDNMIIRLSEAVSGFCRANMNKRQSQPVRSSEMGALIYIATRAGDDGVTAVSISQYFGISKPSVTAMVSALEKQGYIRRSFLPGDKRVSPLFPTEKGLKLVEETYEAYHAFSQRLIDKLGREKAREFTETLELAARMLQQGE
ncbi:MAG: MarR family transcriptional regulator [Clostridia bacterium]|nr:MarR family transcriptional regulator [Clostridia bacterium]